MSARMWMLAVLLTGMAWQSQFSSTFFFSMVKASLSDMQAGIDTMMVRDTDHDAETGGWQTASVQLSPQPTR